MAFWAPGGLGVREWVFVTAMSVALPRDVRNQFGSDTAVLPVFLAFLSLLLRLWTTAGELVLASIAYALDIRGAMGQIPPEQINSPAISLIPPSPHSIAPNSIAPDSITPAPGSPTSAGSRVAHDAAIPS